MAMTQKEQANAFRALHRGPVPLIVANAWDAASASLFAQMGFTAIATTSSGVAASLGYADGEQLSRTMLLDAVARMTRVVACPVTVDVEAGYGQSIEELLETVRGVIARGAMGINLEDSTKRGTRTLLNEAIQAERLRAVRQLADDLAIPLVINARTDVFLLAQGEPAHRLALAQQRAHAYQQAGADCFFPIGLQDAASIASLVQTVSLPINILASPATPSPAHLAQMGVARISFGSGLLRAALGQLRLMAQEVLTHGTMEALSGRMLSGTQLKELFP